MGRDLTLKICVIVTFLGTLSCPSALSAVQIVREGRPVAVILVADDASPVAFEAAEELARVVEKATGARLLTFPESELKAESKNFPADRASKILVGDGQWVRKLGVDVSTLPPEGFAIKTVGRHLILAGRDERHTDWLWRGHRQPIHTRGTWFAVCTFLEDFLGVRWLWPGELGEVVPVVRDIRVPETDRTESPALAARALRANCFYGGYWRSAIEQLGLDVLEQFAMHQELERWADHQRLGTSFTVKAREFNSTWLDDFAEEHPNWFAMQPSGRRLLTHGAGRVRMCLSNPGLIDEVVRRVVKYLDEHPSANGYGFWPSDVYGAYCVCDNCKAWGSTPSDLVAHHAAIVGQKVKALRPDRFVTTLAYHKYVAPPQTQVEFPDNVVLSYVGPEVFGYLCDEAHRMSVAYWDGWAKVARKIIWRPNNFVHQLAAPCVYVTKLAEDFRRFYRQNMIGVDFDRLFPHFAADGLNYYVAARLTWNPETPVHEIVDDYCRSGFGPAGTAVRDYFGEAEKMTTEIATARVRAENWRNVDDWGKDPPNEHLTPQRLAALRGKLDQARHLAGDNVMVVKRIAFLAEALDFAEIEAPLYHAVRKAQETKLGRDELEELRGLLARRIELCKQRCDSWAVDVASLSTGQEWFEDQLFPQPEPETTDELPDTYEQVMQLPEQWKFKLDTNLIGEKQQWFRIDHDDSGWKQIRVGEFWDTQGYPDYDGAAWYRLSVKLPAALSGKVTELWFGAADESAKVYVNGQLAGEYDIGPQGWDKPFAINVTDQIKPGRENLIAVRVIDTAKAGGLWKPVKVVTPK